MKSSHAPRIGCAGGIFMCRRFQTAGACLISAGLGMLLGLLLGGGALTVIVSLALTAAGVVIAGKK